MQPLSVDVESSEFLERVKTAFYNHVAPPGSSETRFKSAIAHARSGGKSKLPFDCLTDPGTRLERVMQTTDSLPESKCSKNDDQDVHSALAREELRESAWLAAGQHGFQALAQLPELQQLISHVTQHILQEAEAAITLDAYLNDEEYKQSKLHHSGDMFDLLLPPLRVCLLAEVAAGLIVPGLPAPADTPEHAAALLYMLEIAARLATQELKTYKYEGHTAEQNRALMHHMLDAHAAIHQHVCGWELLLLVSQLVNAPGSSSNSRTVHLNSCSTDLNSISSDSDEDGSDAHLSSTAAVARPAEADFEQQKLAALEKLMWQWQPAMQIVRQIQQQQQEQVGSTGSTAALQVMYKMCVDACVDVLHMVGCKSAASALTGDIEAENFTKCVLGTVMEASELYNGTQTSNGGNKQQQQHEREQQDQQQQQQQENVGQQLSVDVLASQLHVLGGALVLQFVAAAVAGGTAAAAELPLQTVVLLGVLEQVQGMMAAAAVTQKDVADAELTAIQQLELKQQQQQQELHAECDGQHEQQRALTAAALRAEALLPVLNKLLELMQLIRQFTELNAELNDSSASSSRLVRMMRHVATGPTKAESNVTTCDMLFSAAGSLNSSFSEPQHTLSALTQAPISSSYCTNMQQPQAAVVNSLHRDILTAALLLFGCQERAHTAVFGNADIVMNGLAVPAPDTLPPCYGGSSSDSSSDNSSSSTYYELRSRLYCRAVDKIAYKAMFDIRKCCGVTLNISTVKAALLYGRDYVVQKQQQLAQQQQQQGFDAAWATLQHVAEAVEAQRKNGGSSSSSELGSIGDDLYPADDAYGSSSSSSSTRMGRDYGAYSSGSRLTWQQHQQRNIVKAIEVGGTCVRLMQSMWDIQTRYPILQHFKTWWADKVQQQQRAADWWRQQQQQHDPSSSSSSSSSSDMEKDQGKFNSSAANGSRSSSRTAPCPLCKQERAGSAASAGPATAAAVAAATASGSQQQHWQDPFLWRRLLWRLLGRLKPSAQAWYVQHYGMCHHCTDERLWRGVVLSVRHHLWVAPSLDPAQWQLAIHRPLADNKLRGRWTMQYTRALNAAFMQNLENATAASWLSQLVLLSLSPLHLHLIPSLDSAPLCPSSFGPGINHMLSHQFGVGPLLQPCLGKHGQVRMWHVWWHIGIRRYHWIKQQHEQPDQHKAETLDRQGGSCSNDLARSEELQQQGLAPLSDVTLDQLYSDPAARYYAAGFASKQLAPYGVGLQLRSAVRAPHMLASHNLSSGLFEGRLEILQQAASDAVANDLPRMYQMLQVIHAAELQLPHNQGQPPLFPPSFKPESQAGVLTAHHELQDEITWTNERNSSVKCGEAHHVVSQRKLLGSEWAVWCQRYEQLLAVCDACGKPLSEVAGIDDINKVVECIVTCQKCFAPWYCSQQCCDNDEHNHSAVCRHISNARLRYRGKPACTCSTCSSIPATRCWRVLDLLQPEGGPLGTDCGALFCSEFRS